MEKSICISLHVSDCESNGEISNWYGKENNEMLAGEI